MIDLKKSKSTIHVRLSPNAVTRRHFYSRLVLYATKILLTAGIFLLVVHNLGMTEGLKTELISWPVIIVFMIGIVVSFFSIPYLYFSSFRRFKKADEYWDEELFWILPAFFLGTFFLYGSKSYSSSLLMIIATFVILAIHFKFFIAAQRMAANDNSISGEHQYYNSMQYLTLYYVLLIALFFYISPSEILEAVNRLGY